MYNNELLLEEKTRVWEFIQNRALEKSYPQDYLDKLSILKDDMYEICLLPNFENITDILDTDIKLAFNFAKNAHKDQFRRFINMPYIIHPLEMATRLSLVDVSKSAIMGALLHDVTEDCGVLLEDLSTMFGKDVAYYVYYLTDIAKPTDGNRAIRLEINFKHFKQSNWDAHNIKLVDLISNTRSLVLCDPRFAKSYTQELQKALMYFKNNVNYLNESLCSTLFTMTEIATQVIELQNEYNIIKLENKKTNKA